MLDGEDEIQAARSTRTNSSFSLSCAALQQVNLNL